MRMSAPQCSGTMPSTTYNVLFSAVLQAREAQINEGWPRADKQGRDTLEQKMLQPWPPTFRPEVLECGDDAGGGERVPVLRHAGKGIKSDGEIPISDVKIAHVMDAPMGDGVDNGVGKVSMRVEYRNALARKD